MTEQFAFTVRLAGAPAPAGTDLPVVPPPPTQAEMAGHTSMSASDRSNAGIDVLGAILRWLTLTGAIVAIGAVAFRVTVLARVSLEVDQEIRTDYLPAAA